MIYTLSSPKPEERKDPERPCAPARPAPGFEAIARKCDEAIVYTMRRALGVVAAARWRDETKLPRVTLPRGSRLTVIEGRLAS